MEKVKILFFGTSRFSVIVLDELANSGFLPDLIVTVPDKPKGRKLVLTPPEAKTWADKHKVPVIQPESLKNFDLKEIENFGPFHVGIVASYGKIIPQNILDIPKFKTLNVHPSLLPKLRGASPIQSSILTEDQTGVTIIQLDALMDHGPIVAQENLLSWEKIDPPYASHLEEKLGKAGGELLAHILPDWIEGKIVACEQDHERATLSRKITKEDALINFSDSPEINLRKIRAFHEWPKAYYIKKVDGKDLRIIITKAKIENNPDQNSEQKEILVIEKIIPEGKKEMNYSKIYSPDTQTYSKEAAE
jgi:methionyl-tRNA formyltransferase